MRLLPYSHDPPFKKLSSRKLGTVRLRGIEPGSDQCQHFLFSTLLLCGGWDRGEWPGQSLLWKPSPESSSYPGGCDPQVRGPMELREAGART